MNDEGLSPERWQRIEDVLDRAFELPASERLSFVRRVCGEDVGLRAQVEALLAADERGADFLESPAGAQLGTAWEQAGGAPEETAAPNDVRIGPYRLCEEVGRGGMGTVYLAERTDGQFEQRVALKVVKRGMDSEDIHRRFLQERQILARLEHPHIARLLGGGVTDEGLPYFALEYVDGSTITEYCEARRLTIEERLRLFEQICGAVQYAHGNLVVHRDLKPSNILVTEEGRVKLLDFGIAKLLRPEDGVPATMTAEGWQLMTPEYASPEQVRGEPVTTATDVYALGVILYELLTGSRPYRLRSRTATEIERAVLQTDPERPSLVAAQRSLRGDLDTIALKALRKEPEERYASVEALLEDLRRQRSGLPIRATQPTLGYRARKFVQRNKIGVAAAALVMISVVGGVAATVWQARKVADEAAKTAEVKDFLVSLFEVSNPEESKGREVTARELLDRGAERVESELAEEPGVRAEMLHVLGVIYRELGILEEARSLLGQALELRRSIYGEAHVETATSSHVLARVLTDLGEYEAAEQMYREALAVFRREPGEQVQVTETVNDLANLAYLNRDLVTAEALYRESLELSRRLFGNDAEATGASMINIAGLLTELGRYEEAEELFREGLEIERRSLGGGHLRLSGSLSNLALLRFQMGDFSDAASLFREALVIRREHHKDGHPKVAESLGNLAAALHRLGNHEEAEPMYREALAMRRELLGERHPRVAITMSSLATLLFDMGRDAEGERLMRDALAMQREVVGSENPSVATTLSNLATQLRDRGRYDEANAMFQEAIPIFRSAFPELHPRTVNAVMGLGRTRVAQGRLAEAEPLIREALTGYSELYGDEDSRTVRAREVLGEVTGAPDRSTESRVTPDE